MRYVQYKKKMERKKKAKTKKAKRFEKSRCQQFQSLHLARKLPDIDSPTGRLEAGAPTVCGAREGPIPTEHQVRKTRIQMFLR